MAKFEKHQVQNNHGATDPASNTASQSSLAAAQAALGGIPFGGAGAGATPDLVQVFGRMFSDAHSLRDAQNHKPGIQPGKTETEYQTKTASPTPQQQVSAAVKDAEKKLSYGLFDWAVTDSDARGALSTLRGLPKDLQGQAVAKLDPKLLDRLITELPEKERVQFEDLTSNTADPACKLKLFSAQHKSQVLVDAEKDNQQDANPDHHHTRKELVRETNSEVDAEVAFLQEKVKAGKIKLADVQRYIDAKKQEHSHEKTALINQPGTLSGLPDDMRLEYSLQRIESQLQYGIMDWAITDKEATRSASLLQSLPDALRKQALTKLDPKLWKRLFDNIPDQEQRLKLWGEYHLAQVDQNAAAEHDKTKDEGNPLAQTASQKENARLNQQRNQIVGSTRMEVAEEIQFLLDKQAHGEKISSEEVEKLAKRKEHEHKIEMKYNVNLANDTGVRQRDHTDDSGNIIFKKDSKIAWEEEELEQVESALARMPEAHVLHNAALHEYRRMDMHADDKSDLALDPTAQPGIGGEYNKKGMIQITDVAVTGPFRNTGDHRELQDPKLDKIGSKKLGALEETMVHETGHSVSRDASLGLDVNGEYQFGSWFGHLANAAGWNNGLSDPDRIPSLATGALPGYKDGNGNPTDTWEYARQTKYEQFAETYMKAILKPQSLAHDLLDAPIKRVSDERIKLSAAQDALNALHAKTNPPPTPLQIQQATNRLNRQQQVLQEAEDDQVGQRQQFEMMRNEVFHTDVAQASAEQRLQQKGISPEKLKEFKDQAARVSTPEQLERLEQEFAP